MHTCLAYAKNKLHRTLFATAGVFLLAGAALAPFSLAQAADKTTVKVGIISGEDEDVWREVIKQAASKGLTVKTVVFNDYNQPNEALQNGEVDANAFQHQPFLDNQIKVNHYDVVRVGDTAVWPIGLYSKKVKSLSELKDGAVIGVPNDPANEARGLNLLQREGVIKLKPGAGILPPLPISLRTRTILKLKNSIPVLLAVPCLIWMLP
ncbi:hypothetical protein ERHA55_26990 [Erwinia rhapontici]|nr:MetQ/NlpA family ABC transporter substrate-binding protein [Erwinia rhapontici]BCQ45172.1 hypothetical protein ERHA55_26990 [Erwinia rhapontici]